MGVAELLCQLADLPSETDADVSALGREAERRMGLLQPYANEPRTRGIVQAAMRVSVIAGSQARAFASPGPHVRELLAAVAPDLATEQDALRAACR